MNAYNCSTRSCGSGDSGLNLGLFQHSPERDCTPSCNSSTIAPVQLEGAEGVARQYRKKWTGSDFRRAFRRAFPHWRLIRDPLKDGQVLSDGGNPIPVGICNPEMG